MIGTRAILAASASKKSQPPTNLVVVNGSTFDALSISWTNPSTYYSGIEVQRQKDGAGFDPIALLYSGQSSYIDSAGPSFDCVIRIRALNNQGVDSDWVQHAVVRTLPRPPSLSAIAATNPGNILMAGSESGDDKVAGYDASLSTDNGGSWGATVDTGSNPGHTFTGVSHGLTCKVRARTRDTLGQFSSWSVFPSSVVSINDVAGPTAPVPTTVWNDTSKGFDLSWTAHSDALSAMYSTNLQVRYDTGAWMGAGQYPAGAAATGTFVAVADADRGKLTEYRLVTVDIHGNTTYGNPSTAKYSKPKGTFYVSPDESATYETAGTASWRSDTDDVISGFLDGTYATQTGAWFYGTKLATECKTYAPDSARIYMFRDGGNGLSGANNIRQHSNQTKPTGSTALTFVGSADAGPTLVGAGASADYTLPVGWYANFADGTTRGIATVDSGSYRRLNGITDQLFSGLITLVYN